MFIYSGIAEQNTYADGSGTWFWESTTETDAVVNVTLDNISGVLQEFATTGSLSGIEEEANWADWYVNSTTLSLKDNGDLVLTASTTVIGMNGTGFNTFSYLLGKTVSVSVGPIPASFSRAPGGGSLIVQQINGPTLISLTTANLDVTNIDFEMDFQEAPK